MPVACMKKAPRLEERSTIVADITGGGPEIRLQTMIGKIYVRRK
jgi:hypothetical protein